jgi:hypothetical protein
MSSKQKNINFIKDFCRIVLNKQAGMELHLSYHDVLNALQCFDKKDNIRHVYHDKSFIYYDREKKERVIISKWENRSLENQSEKALDDVKAYIEDQCSIGVCFGF